MDPKIFTEEKSGVTPAVEQQLSLSSGSGSSLVQSLHKTNAFESLASLEDSSHSLHVPYVATLPGSMCSDSVGVPGSCSAHAGPVTLCIKLPNSHRIEHKFDCKSDRIKDVIYFAHCFMTGEKNIHLNVNVCLTDNSVPMNIYSDHSLTLYEAGLIHNTVLHFSYR